MDSNPVKLVSSNMNAVTITLHADFPIVHTVSLPEGSFDGLQNPDFDVYGETGAPALLATTRLVEIPLCEDVTLEIIRARYDTISCSELGITHPLLPVQPTRSKSQISAPTFVQDTALYHTDQWIGGPTAC